MLTFDASASDKLVVVVTGEHGHGSTAAACSLVTYDGVALTEAVNRNPVAAGTDIIYNDIWYLNNPGAVHTAGAIVASVDTVPPLVEVSAQENGNIWDGHVTGYMLVSQPSVVAPTFVGGNLDGTVTIAAEFPGELIVPPTGATLIVR